jgi:hypothetical protein
VRVIDALRLYRPAEADYALARLGVRRGDLAGATEAYARACEFCRRDPWAWSLLATRGLALGQSIAESDHGGRNAERVFEALALPFAARAREEERNALRVAVAVRVDGGTPGARTRAALERYNGSNVPWQEAFLSARATSYSRLGDRRARGAIADLKRFQAQRELDLTRSLDAGAPAR